MSDQNTNEAVPNILEQIAKNCGGKINEVGALPDGSGFAIMSIPLRKDHWIYQSDRHESYGDFNVPPMPFRMGVDDVVRIWPYRLPIPGITTLTKEQFAEKIRAAGKYAIRCATMNGKDMDFDPDALLQNLVVGMLGYWTENGLSDDEWANPERKA